MKNLKRLILIMMVLSIGFSILVSASQSAQAQETKRKYLDFSINPVNPHGIPKTLEAKMLKNGWKKVVLDRDVYVHAQFKSPNGLYFMDGWVQKGNEILVVNIAGKNNVFKNIGVVMSCGNIVIIGEEKYGGSGGEW